MERDVDSSLNSEVPERPVLLMLACFIGWLYTAIIIWVLLIHRPTSLHFAHEYGTIFQIIMAAINLGAIVALYGLWKMRYWGLMFYGALIILAIIIAIHLKIHAWWFHTPELLIFVIGLLYIGRFS